MAKIKAKKTEENKNEKAIKKIVKEEKFRTEESETLHRFIIIFIIIIAIVIAIYFISSLVSSDNDDNKNATTNNTVAETSIDYNIVSVGTILNRDQYKKYYVMVYDGEDNQASYYSALLTKYMAKEKHDKIYFCDLSNPLNKDYAKEESNPSAQKVEDFAFGKVTLLEIQNGKITKYIEDIEQIKNILQ